MKDKFNEKDTMVDLVSTAALIYTYTKHCTIKRVKACL